MASKPLTITGSAGGTTPADDPLYLSFYSSFTELLRTAGAEGPTAGGIFIADVFTRGALSGRMNAYRLARGFIWEESPSLTLIGSESSTLTCTEDVGLVATLDVESDDTLVAYCEGRAEEPIEWNAFFTVRIYEGE
jgi:hypothetical protein